MYRAIALVFGFFVLISVGCEEKPKATVPTGEGVSNEIITTSPVETPGGGQNSGSGGSVTATAEIVED